MPMQFYNLLMTSQYTSNSQWGSLDASGVISISRSITCDKHKKCRGFNNSQFPIATAIMGSSAKRKKEKQKDFQVSLIGNTVQHSDR